MAHSRCGAHRKLEDVEAPVRVRVHLREQPIARAAAKEGHSGWLLAMDAAPVPANFTPFPLTPDRPYDDFDLRPSILA